ncbi:MAG TPA: SRPBCC domain-containing protein [Planosporangium sp.]|nr:SRPBCC domain-containing protein [Planosporangium sp.]
MNDHQAEPAFVYQTDIASTPDRLWQALTSGEITRRYWFDRRIASDWVVGSPVRFYDGDSDVVTDTGAVVECQPPRRLVYTFQPVPPEDGGAGDGGAAVAAPTRVAFDLTPLPDGRVRLRLVHDQLADPAHVDAWRQGWTPILANLQSFLEGRDPAASPVRGRLATDGVEDVPPTLTRRVPRSPADVFHALTDASLVARWWRPEGASTTVHAVEAREGGALSLDVTLKDGEVVKLRGMYRQVAAGRLLVHTLRAEGDPRETVVTWRLLPDGQGTLLELTETSTDEDAVAGEAGWAEGVDQLVLLLQR